MINDLEYIVLLQIALFRGTLPDSKTKGGGIFAESHWGKYMGRFQKKFQKNTPHPLNLINESGLSYMCRPFLSLIQSAVALDGEVSLAMFSSKELNGSKETHQLLNCLRLPGRLSTGETAALLGFREHDMTLLVAAKQLKPLGEPAANSPKYFASVDIVVLAHDPAWLSKATKLVAKYWQGKNERKKKPSDGLGK